MILEIGLIAVGVPFGLLLRGYENFKSVMLKAFTIIVYALLFFFGLKVGANDTIMNNLHIVGIRSLLLSFAIILGSIIAGICIKKFLKTLD